MEEVAYPSNLSKPDIWQTLPLNSLSIFVDWIDTCIYIYLISLSTYLLFYRSSCLVRREAVIHFRGVGGCVGVGVACFFFVLFKVIYFYSKRKDEEEKKGGVSDGGEADFQTRPPTLTTYPRFFFIIFYFDIYIYTGVPKVALLDF